MYKHFFMTVSFFATLATFSMDEDFLKFVIHMEVSQIKREAEAQLAKIKRKEARQREKARFHQHSPSSSSSSSQTPAPSDDTTHISSEAQSALHQNLIDACKKNEYARAFGLIKQGANPLIIDKHGNNLAHIAAYAHAKETLLMLTKKTTVNVNAYNNRKETPLSIAIRQNTEDSSKVAASLLRNGAHPNKPATTAMWTPLMIASRLNNAFLVKQLLKHDSNQHHIIKRKNALSIALENNFAEVADLLFVDPAATTCDAFIKYIFTKNGQLIDTTKHELLPLLRILQKHGKGLNRKIMIDGKEKPLIIHIMRKTNDYKLINNLLTCGAHIPDYKLRKMYTIIKRRMGPVGIRHFSSPAERATSQHICKKMIVCLKHRKKPVLFRASNTILIEAAKDNLLYLARGIIDHCPQYAHCQNARKQHALHYLAENQHTSSTNEILLCIKALAPFLNLQDLQGKTPLMLTRNPRALACMLAHGAHPDIQDKNGNTALNHNIIFPTPLNICLLLEHGAQFLKDKKEQTPVDVCREMTKIYEHNVFSDNIIRHPLLLLTRLNPVHNNAHLEQGKHELSIINTLLTKTSSDATKSIQAEAHALMRSHIQFNPQNMRRREMGLTHRAPR